MKPTKKPKTVDVVHVPHVCFASHYKCPACCVTFHGRGPDADVIRFKCSCGQELIVGNHIKQKLSSAEIKLHGEASDDRR